MNGIKIFTGRNVPVFINAMVQDGTYGRVKEFQAFCLGELGAKGVIFSSVTPIGKAKDAPDGLQLSAANVKYLFKKGLMSPGDENADVFARLSVNSSFYCNAGIGQCFISADGKVYACHYFQNIREEMGDLQLKPLERIYRDYAGSVAIAVALDWARLDAKPDGFSCGIYGTEQDGS